MKKYGIFNVGWVFIKKDGNGLNCLGWWRERCLEWCYKRLEGGRYGDQKYLEEWPFRFEGVHVIGHKGINLAPYNVNNYTIEISGEQLNVDGQPLIFFHFHGFRRLTRTLFAPGYARTKSDRSVREFIYKKYLHSLVEAQDFVLRKFGGFGHFTEFNMELDGNFKKKLRNGLSSAYRLAVSGTYIRLPRGLTIRTSENEPDWPGPL
jgi:hypothetical protein